MGGVQSDDHVKQSVLIHLFSSHKTTYLSSHFPTSSSSFFDLKFSHFSSFLLSLSLFFFFLTLQCFYQLQHLIVRGARRHGWAKSLQQISTAAAEACIAARQENIMTIQIAKIVK